MKEPNELEPLIDAHPVLPLRQQEEKKPYVWVEPNPAGVSRQLMTLEEAWEFVSEWRLYGSEGEGIELTLTYLTDAEVEAIPSV